MPVASHHPRPVEICVREPAKHEVNLLLIPFVFRNKFYATNLAFIKRKQTR